MDTYWVPGVNHLGTYGRWAFAEFTEVYQIESDFKAKIESEFAKMVETVSGRQFTAFTPARNRSEYVVRQQLGSYPALLDINDDIWSTIQSNERRTVQLSDLAKTRRSNIA